MVSRLARLLPYGSRAVIRNRLLRDARPQPYQVRGVSGPPWRADNDPFRQMDTFMRDMDRKLRHSIDSAFAGFKQFPNWNDRFPGSISVTPRFSSLEPLGSALDVSSNDTFKLLFNCRGAKQEDINVTLKDNVLTVKVQVLTEGDGSKVMRHLEHQQTLPEGVESDKLESSLSPDGELTVRAPRQPPEGPQTIKVQRE